MSKDNLFLASSVLLGALTISGALFWSAASPVRDRSTTPKLLTQEIKTELPVRWGTLLEHRGVQQDLDRS